MNHDYFITFGDQYSLNFNKDYTIFKKWQKILRPGMKIILNGTMIW